MTNIQLTQEYLKSVFDYHEDGYLVWKINTKNHICINKIAGCNDKKQPHPNWKIGLNGKYYYASRLIFLWHKGYFPIEVDHWDNDSLNNRINNLRDASISQNRANRSSHKGSTSKYLGVSLSKVKHKNKTYNYWKSGLCINREYKYLGTFKSEIEAAKAYNEAALIYHKEFANLNLIE